MGSEAPNILLITTDQQRSDTVGDRAPSFLRVPHLNQLAREGTTFTCAYSDNPLCVPARIALMSGQSVWTHGMLNNGYTSNVLGHQGTLPDLLRAGGYQTCAIGKMHFFPERVRHGFEQVILPADYYRYMASHSEFGFAPMRHGLGQNELYPSMATVPEALTLTSWLCEQAVDFIRDRRDPSCPFFLWLSLSKPHPPLDPPEPYYSMYPADECPNPVIGDWAEDSRSPVPVLRQRYKDSYDRIPDALYRAARSAYYGLVTQIDYNLGRVFAALQDRDQLTETAVLFTSDHGDFLGDHRLGNKVLFHEPSAHVPFILRLPRSDARLPRGSTFDVPVSHCDVLPTLLSIAGLAPQTERDGTDVVSLAQSGVRRYIAGTSAGADLSNDRPWYFAITDGTWKYIWYPEGPSCQFFDLKQDPFETTDLGGMRHPEMERLRSALVAAMQSGGGKRFLADGSLPEWDSPPEPAALLRTTSWPGYHTESYHLDVRH